jgi:hypothetical protein
MDHIARRSSLSSRAIRPERERKLVAMTGSEHDSALRRLEMAMEKQDRSRARYQAAIGTPVELGAYTKLSAANEQVAARGAWLDWVDDDNYRGVHAGPFSLRAKNDERGRSAEVAAARGEKAASRRS